jgi:hypothetical protein
MGRFAHGCFMTGVCWGGGMTSDKCVLSDRLMLHRLHTNILKKRELSEETKKTFPRLPPLPQIIESCLYLKIQFLPQGKHNATTLQSLSA